MSIPQSFIQDLVARADVVEVIGRYVPLKKGGANFMGLCPFHGEKSPSFSVSPSKQFFHCFGCGKNGNVIGFLMDHNGMSFVEAVHDLAQQYGMQVPKEQASTQDLVHAQSQRAKQHDLIEMLEKAAVAYKRHLRNSQQAIDYLKKRGLSGKIALRFGLGYAPAGWRPLASIFGTYDAPELVECGLVIAHAEGDGQGSEKRYDRFRDRIMFPIRNAKGECIGFGGRVLGDEKPKYLNSPETPVFSKGQELYGLYEARQALREAGFVLVTEGYMDVVALAQWGLPNAVATLGTACTNEHLQKLFRYTDSVVFSFDGDSAGRRAARKALDGAITYASDTRTIKFLFLPAEHDPDSFIREHGKDAFSAYISTATPLSQFLIDTAREGCALSTAEGRAKMAAQAFPLWDPLPQGALKLQLLAEIADLVQLSPAELQSIWNPSRNKNERAIGKKRSTKLQNTTDQNTGAVVLSRSGTRASRARPQGVSRVEVVCRLIVQQPSLWHALTNEDQAMLCAQPIPYGAFYVWLEGELLTHGDLNTDQLHALLPAHSPFFASISEVLASSNTVVGSKEEANTELRDILNRMLIEQIKDLQNASISAAGQDPTALARYKDLQARRLQLEHMVTQAVQSTH